MTEPDKPPDPGRALREIADHLPKLRKEVEKLRDGRRRLWLALGVLAAVFSVAVAVLAFIDAQQNSARIAAEARAQAAAADFAQDLCQTSNVFRARDLKVWEQFLPADLPDTPAGRAETARLLAQVRALDSARDCSRHSDGQ